MLDRAGSMALMLCITDPQRVIGVPTLVLTIVVCGAIYGGVMGSHSALQPGRWLLVPMSAIKVPILLLGTTGVCFGAFFVISTVLGLRDDFARSTRALLAGQAACAVTLASLAPVTAFFYATGITHAQAQLLSAGMFTVAAIAGQAIVRRRDFRPLFASAIGMQHRAVLALWVGMYVFVGIQMVWILRPYIGVPGLDVSLFRDDAISNAYMYFAN